MSGKCAACGKTGLRRVHRAFVLFIDGSQPRTALVCAPCYSSGLVVVAPKIAPVVDATKVERLAQLDVLTPFIKAIAGRLRAMQSVKFLETADDAIVSFQAGKIEATEAILSLLESGRT